MPFKYNPYSGTFDIVRDEGVTSVDTDSGSATPTAGGVLTIAGGTGIDTSGAGSTVTITNTGVIGPGGAVTDNAVARWDTTSGTLLQNSVVTIDDAGVIAGVTQLDVDNLRLDGNTVSATDTNGSIVLSPDGTGGAVVTTDLTVGNSTQDVAFTVNGVALSANVSVEASNTSDLGGIVTHRHSDTPGFGGHLVSLRSRNTHAAPSAVASGDTLSIYAIAGYDGADYAQAASIITQVDGAIGLNDMPGRMIFSTSADGAQTPIEALRIDSSQVLTLANALTVANGGTGATTLTDGGILLGSGTGAVTALAQATNGQLPIGSTGADPTLATLTAGTGISVTNGAGSIQLDVVGGGHFLDSCYRSYSSSGC